MSENGKIFIFDTTLRDGEQAPGASMNKAEKLRIAALLDAMGVDVIEAGFPGSSLGDFDAVRAVAAATRNSIVAGLSRAVRSDIDKCADALKPAKRKRIHTFISTSAVHMEYKLRMTPEQVLSAVIDSVGYARNLCDDVEWSCEDGTRSDRDFLCRCFEAAIQAGASTVNIADTVGYTMPGEFIDLIQYIMNRVPNIDKVRFSVHCHDDLGLGVANSLAAISAGARQIECTINGIGERAGNASLEEVVMALDVRRDLFRCNTSINTRYLSEASRLVSEITGFPVPPNKAVVGSNAFAHESGIHQHGVINHRATYEIMEPAEVGAAQSSLVMGKHSGRHAFLFKLKELGLNLEENSLERAFEDFKHFADTRKSVSDEEILALAEKELVFDCGAALDLHSVVVHTSKAGATSVQLAVTKNGRVEKVELLGREPFTVISAAFQQIFPNHGDLKSYDVNLSCSGGSAMASALVKLGSGALAAEGRATADNTFNAFSKAYLNALVRILNRADIPALS